jgi:hypothetical protein
VDHLADVQALLAAIAPKSNSKPYFIADPTTALSMASAHNALGGKVFPELAWNGGSVLGVPFLISDGITDSLLALDAALIASGLELPEISTSTNALVEASDDPAAHAGTGSPSTPTPMAPPLISLFQQNAVGIRCTQFFGVSRLRSSAVAIVSTA